MRFLKSTYALHLFFYLLAVGVHDGMDHQISDLSQTNSQVSNQEFTDPELTGPDRLCNVFGSVLGDFSGGGNNATDLFYWKIINPQGENVFDRSGGSLFQVITFTFSGSGVYQVQLRVERAGIKIYEDELDVSVILGPQVTLKESYIFCENETLDLPAIDPNSPGFSEYLFEWKDNAGKVIGNQNILTVSAPGDYSVNFYLKSASGVKECESTLTTKVSKVKDYQITASQTSVCPDLPTVFSTEPNLSGTWKYLKSTESTPVTFGFGNTIEISPNQILNGEGDYKIIFEPDPQANPACLITKSIDLRYNPQPEFLVYPTSDASDCGSFDGELTVEAITALDKVMVEGTSLSTPPLLPGEKFTLTGLKSGTYSLVGILGNCSNSFGTIIPLALPPAELIFSLVQIKGEKCTPTGKEKGGFVIKFQNPPSSGTYRIINQKGTLVEEKAFSAISEIPISIPGGVYYVEVFSNQNCNIPEASKVNIPSLNQTGFSIPDQLAICQSYDFIPQTSEDLVFVLTHLSTGIQQVKNSGQAFNLTLAGTYSLIGNSKIPGSTCPTEKKLSVTLVDPVDFEPVLTKQDCFGNKTYKADIKGRDPSTVSFEWRNEKDQIVGTGQFLFPTSTGEFKLDVQPVNSTACPIPPKKFTIEASILELDLTLESTKLCEFGPKAILNLSSTFPEEITDIEWRRYDGNGIIENLPQFNDLKEITVDKPGTYEAAVFSRIPSIEKDCELGRKSLAIELIPEKVPFTVPSSLSICEPYPLIPQSAVPLQYSLTYPDGRQEIKNWNEPFTIMESGTYILLGYNPDSAGTRCPDQKTFTVTVNPPVEFNPVLVELSCDWTYTFRTELVNYSADKVDYIWRNSSGTVVGRDSVFSTDVYGVYNLEVQPKGSIPCQIELKSIEAPIPIVNVPVRIQAQPLCPDQVSASLLVEADLSQVASIQWWLTDFNANRTQLVSETGKKEILAVQEGTYEVILLNAYSCPIGTDQVLLLRSTDEVRPEVKEKYQVCPRYEIGPNINPGSFQAYEWYFENTLVSTSPIYKPLQTGNFRLVVFSAEGCAYEASFVTEEECELRVSFPNAIQPGDPNRPFLIYTNYLIDELEVWIFSKWGEVIFQCKNTSLITESSTCLWDGYLQGDKLPPGSYAYRVKYRNIEKNIVKEQLGSILVID